MNAVAQVGSLLRLPGVRMEVVFNLPVRADDLEPALVRVITTYWNDAIWSVHDLVSPSLAARASAAVE